jgi:hypothetical protein
VTPASPSRAAVVSSSPASARGNSRRRLLGLDECTDDVQGVRSAVGLEVDPPDQRTVQQERPHVVAVLAMRRRSVDLDAVMKSEQTLHARTEKDQRSNGHNSAVPRLRRGIVCPAGRYAGADQPWTSTRSSSPSATSLATAGLACPAASRK